MTAPVFSGKRNIIKWPGAPRQPLPPFPSITSSQPAPPESQCWAKAPYSSTLPFNPPSAPDIDYHRGNFIGVRVPGFTAGDNDKDRSLVVNWLQPTWPVDQQKLVLRYFIESCSYTHWDLSIPQAWNNGIDKGTFISSARLAQQFIPYLSVQCYGGGPETWDDIVPWVDALLAANIRPILVVCWQIDKWYSPMDAYRIVMIVSNYAKKHGLKVAVHWINGACAWWDDATCAAYGICDRFTYQQKMTNVIDYHYMQVDPAGPIDELQSGEAKVLQSLTTQKLVMAEDDAQAEYDNPHECLEIYGDMKGYLSQCINYNNKVMSGYYNGARRSDGSVL